MRNVRGMVIFLVGVCLTFVLTVFVPSTEAQSTNGYQGEEPQGQYTLIRHRRYHRRHYRRYYLRHHRRYYLRHYRRYYLRHHRPHYRRHFRHSGAPEQRPYPVGIVTT